MTGVGKFFNSFLSSQQPTPTILFSTQVLGQPRQLLVVLEALEEVLEGVLGEQLEGQAVAQELVLLVLIPL